MITEAGEKQRRFKEGERLSTSDKTNDGGGELAASLYSMSGSSLHLDLRGKHPVEKTALKGAITVNSRLLSRTLI